MTKIGDNHFLGMPSVQLSPKTLAIMRTSSTKRWEHGHDVLWRVGDLTFYSGLVCTNGSTVSIERGRYIAAEVSRDAMGILASLASVPNPCVCVFRLESIFKRSTGALRVNAVCTYFPEALVAAGVGKTERLRMQDVVLANDRMELSASAVLGCISTSGATLCEIVRDF